MNLGLNLTSNLNLNSTASIAAAAKALQLASAKIEVAYQSLTNPTSSSVLDQHGSTSASSSAYIAYVNAQTANYQLALDRLSGSS